MRKKIFFCLSLLLIYILFLSKDTIIGLFNNKEIELCTNDNYYQKEYENISKLLEIEPNNYQIRYSKVILRDVYEFYNKFSIDKGSKDMIKEGDLVINELGLIGKINKVYQNYSEVIMLTNKDISLSVKIKDAYGILSSKDKKIIVKNIKLNEEINLDDQVYTSGLTGYPEGILIGKVINIKKDDLELEYQIEIEPVVNLKEISYVGVIRNATSN